MKYIILLTLLALSSCIQIGDKPQPQNHYLLEPEISANSGLVNTQNEFTINLEPIDLALFLDKPYIAFHDQANHISYQQTERWAEPLASNISRVIRNNLIRSFHGTTVTLGPWEKSQAPLLTVKIVIDDFSSNMDNSVSMTALYHMSWSGKSLNRQYNQLLPAGASTAEQVKALNTNLNQFCSMLADDIRRLTN